MNVKLRSSLLYFDFTASLDNGNSHSIGIPDYSVLSLLKYYGTAVGSPLTGKGGNLGENFYWLRFSQTLHRLG